MLARYLDFDLRLFDHCSLADGSQRLLVQVSNSPVGELAEAETVLLAPGLRDRLVQLQRRAQDWPAMVELGREIGAALLPPRARAQFRLSMAKLLADEGLRLRLRCESSPLDALPWEMAHVSFGDDAGAADKRHFIALDRRLSLVRREVCTQLLSPARRTGPGRRLVTLMCEPTDRCDPLRPLAVGQELAQLREVLEGVDGITLASCEAGTRQALTDLLTQGADIFHFAGHGEFQADVRGGGQGCLLLRSADGTSDPWPAAEMALSLANKGIQLAVLGACRSAQRDGDDVWAGIAPTLARAGIPAVIGMQYTVFDLSAQAFSRRLYYGWSRGVPLEQAVVDARVEICNLKEGTGRDFATPVLYLREQGMGFAEAPPQVVDERKSAPGPAAEGPPPVVELLAELFDYKCVHDALHSARTGEFNLILLRRTEFPGGSTVSEFTNLARGLRKRYDGLERLGAGGRCDKALMAAVTDEFGAALQTLDEALAKRCAVLLEDAVAAFESLLSTQPVRVDTWMSSLAQRLQIERMVLWLRALPLSQAATAGAVDELNQLGERLRRHAVLHSQCQALDNYLSVVRKAADGDRFVELRRQQRQLAAQLARLLPLWDAAGVDKLRDAGERLAQSVAAQDEPGARDAFDALCGDFDFGFYTIDADFKELCHSMMGKAEAQLPGRRGGVSA